MLVESLLGKRLFCFCFCLFVFWRQGFSVCSLGVNKFLGVVLFVFKGILCNCTLFFVCLRYISIKPDNRKLANGTNVLGLLVDTLLKEGFHLVSTRASASGDKSECYVFERIKSPQVLGVNKTPKPETTTMPAPSEKWHCSCLDIPYWGLYVRFVLSLTLGLLSYLFSCLWTTRLQQCLKTIPPSLSKQCCTLCFGICSFTAFHHVLS